MALTIYPTGTTVYHPEKCWNGYTIYQSAMFSNKSSSAILIDMNGNVVNQWKGIDGMPNRILPGGYVMGNTGTRSEKYGFQDQLDLVQIDWEGNIVWKFNRWELVKDPRSKAQWMARQHHDYQREGSPAGYYAPGMAPFTDKGNTLILCHTNLYNKSISEKLLLDDVIIEVTWDGKIVWEWKCSDHFEEYGFSEDARNVLARTPGMFGESKRGGDWMHINSISTLGPNRWYDAGDERFHPDNIIWDSRQSNIIAVIEKKTGKIVWQIGPEYNTSPELRKLGWIIGQHHAHMIPRGLPGEGNLLIYDNGGSAGYGVSNPGAPNGVGTARRDFSRVLELNPLTLEVVWTNQPAGGPGSPPSKSLRIYSGHISSAQRLVNGNTLINEGASGHFIEVTPELDVVWDYVSPYFSKRGLMNHVYRAYRVPYDWVPQVEKPAEIALPEIDISSFRVPGSPKTKVLKTTRIR
jgi:hypothetical protein